MSTAQELLNQGLPNVQANNPRIAVANSDYSGYDPSVRRQIAENAQLAVRGSYSPQVQADPYTQDFIQTGRLGAAGATTTAIRPYGTSAPIISGVTPGTSGVITDPITGQTTSAPPAYGASAPAQNSSLAAIYAANRAPTSYTGSYESETARRQQVLQGSIDAINARYATMVDDARQTGEGQQNRVRALSNAGGGLYGNPRVAQENGVEKQTQREISALEAQRGAELAALQLGISGEATQAAAQQAQESRLAAAQYVDTLVKTYGLSQDDAKQVVAQRLAEAQATGQYNGQDTLDMRRFLQDQSSTQFDQGLATRNADLQNRELQLRIDEAQKKNYSIVQGDDGSIIAINPQNPSDRVNIGRYSRPVSSGGGGYGGVSDSNYLSSLGAGFAGKYGQDNYLDTGAYGSALQQATQRGLTSDFLKRYDPTALLNPKDATATRYLLQ